jgi:hypothetical protein
MSSCPFTAGRAASVSQFLGERVSQEQATSRVAPVSGLPMTKVGRQRKRTPHCRDCQPKCASLRHLKLVSKVWH